MKIKYKEREKILKKDPKGKERDTRQERERDIERPPQKKRKDLDR